MLGIIIVVLVGLFCLYLGYQNGILKEFVDFIILLITSLISGIISDKLCIYIYKFIPFLNFTGKSEGLKAINIILWKLILYVLMIFILIFIIRKILKKTGLEEKINESIIEANTIKKIFGAVVAVPLTLILLFNIFLILLSPNFNLTSLKDSSATQFVMEKTPLFASGNKNLYENEVFILELLSEEEITPDNFEEINEQILANYIDSELVEEDILRDLEDKMIGKRNEKQEDTDEEDIEDSEEYEDTEDEDWDEEDFEDSDEDEDTEDEDWDEEDFEDSDEDEDTEDEDWDEEDWDVEDWDEEDWDEEE